MIRNRILFYLAMFFSLSIALASYRFLFLDLNLAFADMPEHLLNRKVVFVAHIAASPIALLLGSMNMLDRRRKKRPTLHRWTGRAYAVAILIGGLSGLWLAVTAAGGIVASLGFGILAVLWIGFTAQAVRLAMARDFKGHRRWMIRSFALTFAAVTLRLYLPFFFMNGLDYTAASVCVAWMCWVPNLIAAEWYLRR